MTDIMADFKNTKFVIQENSFDYSFKYIAVLCDLAHWNENYFELIKWAENNECEVLGMTVNIKDEKHLTLFALRWS